MDSDRVRRLSTLTGRVGWGRVGSGQEVFKWYGLGRVTLTRSEPTREKLSDPRKALKKKKMTRAAIEILNSTLS